MGCVLKFNENETLSDQNLSAWGLNQSTDEEPAYREEDIKSEKDRAWFKGYKEAYNEAIDTIENSAFDGDIAEKQAKALKEQFHGDICLMLYSIIDGQEEV